MNNTAKIFLRSISLAVIGFLLLEFAVESDGLAFMEHPVLILVWAVFVMLIVIVEVIVKSLNHTLYNSLSEKEKEQYDANEIKRKEEQFSWVKEKYAAMLDSTPMEEEDEIMLDHNYDGIRELDNNLPPWWKYLFYATIIFAGWYMVYYHILGGPNQLDEYEKELVEAEASIAKYKEENKDEVSAETVELLTDNSDLKAGKEIYDQNCVACHAADGGGGIGPNLTDDYWILGGGVKNVYYTISEGGRSGKGMVPWKDDFSPHEIAQVASYVIALQDDEPADPKEAQGDKWEDGDDFIH